MCDATENRERKALCQNWEKTDENPLLWKRDMASWAKTCQRNQESGWELSTSPAFLLDLRKGTQQT